MFRAKLVVQYYPRCVCVALFCQKSYGTYLSESHAFCLLGVRYSAILLHNLINGNLVQILQIQTRLSRLDNITNNVVHIIEEKKSSSSAAEVQIAEPINIAGASIKQEVNKVIIVVIPENHVVAPREPSRKPARHTGIRLSGACKCYRSIHSQSPPPPLFPEYEEEPGNDSVEPEGHRGVRQTLDKRQVVASALVVPDTEDMVALRWEPQLRRASCPSFLCPFYPWLIESTISESRATHKLEMPLRLLPIT